MDRRSGLPLVQQLIFERVDSAYNVKSRKSGSTRRLEGLCPALVELVKQQSSPKAEDRGLADHPRPGNDDDCLEASSCFASRVSAKNTGRDCLLSFATTTALVLPATR